MLEIRIRAFGIAKDILRQKSMSIQVKDGHTIGQLRAQLAGEYPDFKKLRSLSFAINEEYVDDDAQLHADDEVVIIPPVSGG